MVYYQPILNLLDIEQLKDKDNSSKIDGEDALQGILVKTNIKSDDESIEDANHRNLAKPHPGVSSRIRKVLSQASLAAGNSKTTMPKWYKHKFKKLSEEERLATWAQFQQRKFEFIGNNFKHLKKDTI